VITARQAFERIVADGCPRWLLSVRVKRLKGAVPTDAELTTDVKAVGKTLKTVGRKVDNLAKREGVLEVVPELSELIYALSRWDRAMKRLKGQHDSAVDHARALLIATVHTHTQSSHDEEISLLIEDVTGEETTVDAQKMWRTRHAHMINWATTQSGIEALTGINQAITKRLK